MAAALLGAACGRETATQAPPAGGAGTYVIVSDSSRVSFVLSAVPAPIAGAFTRVRGALTFEADSRGFLTGSGTIVLDLSEPALADTAFAAPLLERFFQVDRDREFRTAELNVRELTGQWFRSGVAAGAVRPVRAIGRLTVHGMAMTRPFEGEIAPTPAGYRLTTTTPLLFSIAELRMGDELADFAEVAGLAETGDAGVVSVDLWLSRREPAAPSAPEGG